MTTELTKTEAQQVEVLLNDIETLLADHLMVPIAIPQELIKATRALLVEYNKVKYEYDVLYNQHCC